MPCHPAKVWKVLRPCRSLAFSEILSLLFSRPVCFLEPFFDFIFVQSLKSLGVELIVETYTLHGDEGRVQCWVQDVPRLSPARYFRQQALHQQVIHQQILILITLIQIQNFKNL